MTKRRLLAGLLTLIMVLQALVPGAALAKGSKPSNNNLITIGKLTKKDYPQIDKETALREAREQKNKRKGGGATLFSTGSPYIPGQQPGDADKPKYLANITGKVEAKGLDDGDFDWNRIFGDKPIKLELRQLDKTKEDKQTNPLGETGLILTLEVNKAGEFKLTDRAGNLTDLPLFSADGNPFEYQIQVDRKSYENVELIISTNAGTPGSKFEQVGDKQIATLSFTIGIQQLASTKFVSEWHTGVAEADRPQIEGYFKVGEDLDNDFNFPKNDTTRTILRSGFLENFVEDEENGPWAFIDSELETTPETVEVKTDTAGLTFKDNNGVKTVEKDGHKFEYAFTYDVITGGKLTMTEILPVTFDANGGKFASITDENAEQKIIKEVEYGKDLTDKAEDPTKDRETFKGWSTTQNGKNPVTDQDLKNIKEAKTFYAIWDNNDITVEELTVHESFKDGTGYVNDFIPTLDQLKGQVKIKDAKGDPQPLTDEDKLQILDDSGNPIADTDLKDKLYEKLKEDDTTEVSRDITLKAKVTHKNGTSQTVDIPIKVIKNIYEAKTKEGKPNYVPDDYVKVTVDPTTKAEKPQKYFYYVNPKASVVIPGKDPVGTGSNQFTKWLIKETDTEYKLAEHPRYQFTEAETTIEAQYVSDVIPQAGTEKPSTVPSNFVSVKFVPTGKATDTAEKIYWVNPDKAVTIPVANPVGKQYFTFKEWKIGAQADGAVYKPGEAKKFTEATTITATYDEAKNIISYNPKEPITRPDGYVRVTFAADPGLKLTEQKAYYVKANAGIKLGNDELVKPGYEAQTGYKFEKWDREDSLVIEAADIVVTAKATKLENVIPETNDQSQPNEKPEGYKVVTFVIKDEDKAKGSIEGVTKFYVNPTKYVTINPPEAKPKTGFEFGAWDKDATIPTVYDKDTTITGAFNGLKDVIPKTKSDDSEKPAGYVTVTFTLQQKFGKDAGEFVEGETTVYYVNPNKDVTITPPKTSAYVGYKFSSWSPDTTKARMYTMPNTDVLGSFEKIGDVIPSTDKDGKPNPKPEGYVTVIFTDGKHGTITSGKKVYYINPNANVKMSDLTFARNSNRPVVTPDVGYKFSGWSKDADHVIKSDLVVSANYLALDDVIPKDKPTGGENEKPDDYITVTFVKGEHGNLEGTTVYYVNPDKAVVLKDKAPTVKPDTGYDFARWDTTIEKAIQYKDGDKITALYNEKGDVIPQEKTDGSDKPEGYLTVTFNKGVHGELSGKTVYYVKPNKAVTVPAPTVTPKTGYKQKTGDAAWDQALTQKFTEENTTITAQYEEIGDVIPQVNTDGSDKPNGYVTVKFKAVNGSLKGTTTYYVNGEKEVDLTNTAKAITKNPNVGYTAEGGTWDKPLKAKFIEGEEITFTFVELADVIEKTGEDTKMPDGYVTVKLIPTGKATDATKAEKSYWVNPKKEVTIPSTNPVGRKITDANDNTYTFIFKQWTSTRGIHGIWKPGDEIKGTFTQDTDIEAKYNVKAEKIVNGPVAKDNVVTPKGDVPNAGDLIKNIPGSEEDPLPDGTTFTYKDGDPDLSKPGEKTVVVEVHYPNGKTAIVNVPITVVDNVVPQKGNEKPKVPDNYVKVTVDTTNKATDNTKFEKVFWVKPGVEVTIPDILAPTGKEETIDGVKKINKFVEWKLEGSDPAKTYKEGITDTFTAKESKIVATYEYDKNVEPVGKDNQLIPQGSTPSPKDFIKNPYDDNDPNNPNNLPPGTKFEFLNGNPDTSKPGEGKTTIKVIYPNGEEKTVEVPFTVTGDVVEQPDPNTKPAVPDNFVKVTVDPTDQAVDSTPRVFWVNPEKVVEIPVNDPTAKDGNKIFKGWDSPLKQQFRGETTIKATFGPMPRPTSDYVFTEQGVQPTPKDYKNAITPPAGKRIKDVVVVDRPNVDKPGKTSATVKVIYEDGTTDQMTVPVFVQKKDTSTPDLRPYPVPGDGGNSGNQPNVPNQPNQPNVGKDALNTTDHYQYLIGYPDGNFGPNKGMTRAEAATMFTRLLNERPVKWRHYNAGLSDIRPGDWYANTVGYAVQRGIVSGYPDGSFKPNKPITRAEFAAIASRFDALAQGNAISFSDLAPSHWGYNAIRSAATKGWISGYPDNTFRPEQAITRAEVTAITNRMLNRHADLYWIDAHPSEVIRFGDVKRSDWYFEPIMEATMGHDFIRDRDKKTEHWTGINGKSFI